MSRNKGKIKSSTNESDEKRGSSAKMVSKTAAKLVVKHIKVEEEDHKISLQPRDFTKVSRSAESTESNSVRVIEEPITRLESPVPAMEPSGKTVSAKFEKLEDKVIVEEKQEDQSAKPMAVGWWVLIGGSALVLILIGVVLLSNQKEGLAMEEVEAPSITLEPADPFEGSPEQWFRQRAGGISKQMLALVRDYKEAADDQSRSRFVRSPELFLKRVPSWSVELNPRLGGISENQWGISHTEETAFMTLDTDSESFLPTRLYFVRQGGTLKLDWAASTAWSERSITDLKKSLVAREKNVRALLAETTARQVKDAEDYRKKMMAYNEAVRVYNQPAIDPVYTVVSGDNLGAIAAKYGMSVSQLMKTNELKKTSIYIGQKLKVSGKAIVKQAPAEPPVKPLPPAPQPKPEIPAPVISEPLLVRCLLFRRNEFYAGPYNDKEHAAFMILSPDKEHYLWAYAKRGSKLDLELRKLLDHGSFVVDLKKNIRVTLRVGAGQKDALPSQLELLELIHPEWVRP